MAGHKVAANLLMIFLLAAGFLSLASVVQEVFPDSNLDAVQVTVAYPGASPEEVEEGIIQRIEERVESVEGVSQINSTASEGVAVVLVELNRGEDISRALDEIKAEVDRITSFPVDAEEPEVTDVTNRSRVIEIAVHGEAPERALKEMANRIKDDLSTLPEISYVRTSGVRDYEISIEVPNHVLRSYGLSLEDVARAVRSASLDLPGGRVDTEDEEILVRVEGQNYDRDDFAEIIVRGARDGATLRLDQIAEIKALPRRGARTDAATRHRGVDLAERRGSPGQPTEPPPKERPHRAGAGADRPRAVPGSAPLVVGGGRHRALVHRHLRGDAMAGCLHQHDVSVRVHPGYRNRGR
jgi:multidrug efflux pump subunit AcrB